MDFFYLDHDNGISKANKETTTLMKGALAGVADGSSLVGSCDGLLLYLKNEPLMGSLFIGNPVTGEFKPIGLDLITGTGQELMDCFSTQPPRTTNCSIFVRIITLTTEAFITLFST